jgi:hypothetical protein
MKMTMSHDEAIRQTIDAALGASLSYEEAISYYLRIQGIAPEPELGGQWGAPLPFDFQNDELCDHILRDATTAAMGTETAPGRFHCPVAGVSYVAEGPYYEGRRDAMRAVEKLGRKGDE